MGLPVDRVRVVYDCMVFLQGAARSNSPAGACLLLAEKGLVELCLSEAILAEVGEVLGRPRLRIKFSTLTADLVSEFLRRLKNCSTFFENIPRELTFSRDPKHEPYLNLARMANAQYLVTRDADLLDICTASDSDSKWVRESCPSLAIVDPVTFLRLLRPDSNS